MDLKEIFARVASGELSPAGALALIGEQGEKNLGFARIDMDRLHRRGFPEVIFCPGKTADQIAEIMAAMSTAGQNAFATRATPEQFVAVHARLPNVIHHTLARAITLDVAPLPTPQGLVAVVSAGTCDIPVAEEAVLTATRLGARVERFYDVGVAGLHRLLAHVDTLRQARVLIAVAGFEGALPSVLGGLVDRPIIAVPTSVGYGTGAHGIAALLAMLNSCASGVTVVNIDNGFGAGVAAALINRQ